MSAPPAHHLGAPRLPLDGYPAHRAPLDVLTAGQLRALVGVAVGVARLPGLQAEGTELSDTRGAEHSYGARTLLLGQSS